MLGRTNVFSGGGGTAGDPTSGMAIIVSYPAGSICTCSNGAKTLRSADTCGACIFYPPSSGSWTLSCTDGTASTSKTITVSAGSINEIDLEYELSLLEGDMTETEFKSIWTLGNGNIGDGIFQTVYEKNTNTTNYPIRSGGRNDDVAKGVLFYTTEKYDLTNYSAISYDIIGWCLHSYGMYIVVRENIAKLGTGAANVSYENLTANSVTRRTSTLDISNVKGWYHIECQVASSATTSRTLVAVYLRLIP